MLGWYLFFLGVMIAFCSRSAEFADCSKFTLYCPFRIGNCGGIKSDRCD